MFPKFDESHRDNRNERLQLNLLYFSTFTPSKISVSGVGACAMAMRILAIYWIQKCRRNSFADANITLVGRNVRLVAKDLSRRNGGSPRRLRSSLANVRIIFFLPYVLLVRFFVRCKPKVTLFHEAKDLLLLVACNCFGHSDECEYDTEVDEKHLSLDIHGNYEGGGVCKNCRDNTEGINCNRCKPMFYRPRNKPLNATDVCQRES